MSQTRRRKLRESKFCHLYYDTPIRSAPLCLSQHLAVHHHCPAARSHLPITLRPVKDQTKKKKELCIQAKTYNSGDSLVVTHLTTNPPVSCLTRAERTGSRVFKILWSYVKGKPFRVLNKLIDSLDSIVVHNSNYLTTPSPCAFTLLLDILANFVILKFCVRFSISVSRRIRKSTF
jgi:hypothetical protein